MLSSRDRLRALIVLALPMVLARATQSVVLFADALQVEHLGAGSLAATATGALNTFGIFMLPMGTVFIVQSFVAQLVGRGDRDDAPRFAWYGLAIALAAGLVAIAAIPAIEPALSLAGYSPAVQSQMADYMAIRMFSVAAAVGIEALGNWYGGLGNTWMSMIAGLITMSINVVLNWILIDGHLGAPAMGVSGAALASTISTWIGFAFLATAFAARWKAPKKRAAGLSIDTPRRSASLRAPAEPGLSIRELGRVIRFGLPNGFNWFLEFAAFQLFVNVVMGSLGDDSVAALNVVIAINSLAFMPAFGLATAGAILAGQAIGRGERGEVWPQVKVTLAVSLCWMATIALVYLVAPGPLLSLFDSQGTSNIVELGTTMLLISAAWQLFDAIGLTMSETLRAAGDTFWTAAARLILAWLVWMPVAYVIVEHADGGPFGAMISLAGYVAILALALLYRFRSGAWQRIELIEPKLV